MEEYPTLFVAGGSAGDARVIDGRGAWLVGAAEGDPKEFQGEAIFAEGVSGVTLKNLNAKGWETGLHVKDGREWTVENCDFSGTSFGQASLGATGWGGRRWDEQVWPMTTYRNCLFRRTRLARHTF